jgi:type IV secretion system protein VirD4
LYQALIGYIYYEAPPHEQNMNSLVEMINKMEVREDNENFKNAVDYTFEALEERAPQHFAVRQYKKYKLAAGKTAKSILISCGARLSPFDIEEVRNLMMYDELELDKLGGYIVDTDSSFNFIVSLMYSQLFNLLCDTAEAVCC